MKIIKDEQLKKIDCLGLDYGRCADKETRRITIDFTENDLIDISNALDKVLAEENEEKYGILFSLFYDLSLKNR